MLVSYVQVLHCKVEVIYPVFPSSDHEALQARGLDVVTWAFAETILEKDRLLYELVFCTDVNRVIFIPYVL